MLQTSARLLRLLTLLQARRFWSGAELSERLEVTDRTLRRDVDRLRSLGYPVHSTSGTAGGYSLGAGASLPPLMLDDDEGIAVAVGLQTAVGGSLAGIEDASQRALTKLEQVLPRRLRKRLSALRASIVRLADSGPTVELSVVSQLAAACSEQRELRFKYSARTAADSEREVEPHRIAHVDRRWYLVAWCKQRADWRTFRVDRIQPPIQSGATFTPRASPDDDVAAYVTRSVSSSPYQFKASVIVHAPLTAARAQLPASSGLLEALGPERCRFTTGANSLCAIAGWLGMLGFEFEVEQPAELREELREFSARLERAAGRGGLQPSAASARRPRA
jgi:predicted DNA-binding transcriptional regulator YafY